MRVDEIVAKLKSLGDPSAVEGMARFGITAESVFGVSMPRLRTLAKEIGRDHARAVELWRIPNRETRILRFNVILSSVILLLTALARVS